MKKQNETTETMTREMLLKRMAEAYYKLLAVVVPLMENDEDIKAGIREGLNKFLSNLCIALVGKEETDFYSEDALRELTKDKPEHLVYEHMIPKNYYQGEIVDDFKAGKIKNADDIKAVLEKYWYIATITSTEDEQLDPPRSVPKGWDDQDIFVRYGSIKDRLTPRAACRGAAFPVKCQRCKNK